VINVTIEIGEQRSEKNFKGVSVITSDGSGVQPDTTSITLFGATTLLNSLKTEELKVVLDTAGETLQPRLELPEVMRGKVVLKSVHTTRFVRTN
jgi:hypothetical protein